MAGMRGPSYHGRMATIAFDTLELARKLEAAGYSREQASATADC